MPGEGPALIASDGRRGDWTSSPAITIRWEMTTVGLLVLLALAIWVAGQVVPPENNLNGMLHGKTAAWALDRLVPETFFLRWKRWTR